MNPVFLTLAFLVLRLWINRKLRPRQTMEPYLL